MHARLVDAVATAYRGDVRRSRSLLCEMAPSDDLAWALWAFAAADYDEVVRRTAGAPAERDPDRHAVRSALRVLVQVECERRVVVPVADTAVPDRSPVLGLIAYMLSEAAYSAGLLERSELISRRVLARASDTDPFVPWVRITRLRVLVFLGLADDAAAELDALRGEVADWPAGPVLVASHEALVASVRRDVTGVEEAARRAGEAAPRPTNQVDGMAVAMTGLALSTVGQPRAALDAALAAGPDLGLVAPVSRCHVGDLAIDMSLQLGLVADARRHLARSESYDVEAGSFCAAAVERSRARLDAVTDVDVPDAGPHSEMYMTRERAFADLAALPREPADIEALTRRIAGSGLADIRVWAGRESEQGSGASALTLFPGLAWDALSPQARVVARLAASGMRNRDIGAAMYVSESTVETYVATVLVALGARTRTGIGARVPFDVPASTLPGLTTRQREVAELVAQAMTNVDIAERLSISEKTVEKHVAALFRILGVSSRTAVAATVRAG